MGVMTSATDAYISQSNRSLPPGAGRVMEEATIHLKVSSIETRAIGVGDLVPDFTLPNQHGQR